MLTSASSNLRISAWYFSPSSWCSFLYLIASSSSIATRSLDVRFACRRSSSSLRRSFCSWHCSSTVRSCAGRGRSSSTSGNSFSSCASTAARFSFSVDSFSCSLIRVISQVWALSVAACRRTLSSLICLLEVSCSCSNFSTTTNRAFTSSSYSLSACSTSCVAPLVSSMIFLFKEALLFLRSSYSAAFSANSDWRRATSWRWAAASRSFCCATASSSLFFSSRPCPTSRRIRSISSSRACSFTLAVSSSEVSPSTFRPRAAAVCFSSIASSFASASICCRLCCSPRD
mmetsp:Transcript_38230/g.83164  ORF Transcript_38230/g.83164 Transcript_38230/m.83164 type:complete len:287 (-) Transcript_38230:1478-2338(-)